MSRKETPEQAAEQVVFLPLSELHPFPNHPFRVVDDEKMREMAASIQGCGVLLPGIARIRPEGGYEIVSGHRRKRACELAGRATMPFIVRNMTDDEAVIAMVDTNLQRENILPSERAFALKMKMEALKHQGQRTDVTSRQVVAKLRSAVEIGQKTGESGRQIQRTIRLTSLEPSLLHMVDDRKLAFNPAVELSFLKPEEQEKIAAAMDEAQTTPSLSQAQRLKKASQEGKLTDDLLRGVMAETKKPTQDKSYLNNPQIRKYFPKSWTIDRIEAIVLKLVKAWYQSQLKKKQQSPAKKR